MHSLFRWIDTEMRSQTLGEHSEGMRLNIVRAMWHCDIICYVTTSVTFAMWWLCHMDVSLLLGYMYMKPELDVPKSTEWQKTNENLE